MEVGRSITCIRRILVAVCRKLHKHEAKPLVRRVTIATALYQIWSSVLVHRCSQEALVEANATCFVIMSFFIVALLVGSRRIDW